jgi:hypothetical protein
MIGFAATDPWRQTCAELRNIVGRRYPGFVSGGEGVPDTIPVFSFHDVTEAGLAAQLDYLAVNGYRTVTVGEWVERRGANDGERLVALTFDDGHASLWGIVYPALKKRGMTATAYLLPGETQEAKEVRPFGVRASGDPLVTWPEAAAMGDVVEIGSHSMYHQIMFVSDEPVERYTAAMRDTMYLVDRPMIGDDVTRDYPVGTTLYASDSRLSERLRVTPPPISAESRPVVESAAERLAAIERSVAGSKSLIEKRLDRQCDHFCFPFAIGSAAAAKAVAAAGYRSAAWGVTVDPCAAAAPDVVHIPRIKDDYVYRLPGEGRWSWWKVVREKLARRGGVSSAFPPIDKGDQRRVVGERADG